MIYLEFDTQRIREVHSHKNYEVLFVLDGNCTVIVEDASRTLSAGEFIVLNSGQRHGYHLGGGKNRIGRFHIPYDHISDENDKKDVIFLLSFETNKKKEAMQQAGDVLSKIFAFSYRGNEFFEIEIRKLYYKFLEILFENFVCIENEKIRPSSGIEADRRIYEIMEYVNHNYNKNIRLNDLASRLFLSSAYLSKYIKQQLGVNFVELLSKTRLYHAAQMLIHSDETIAQIALNVGFSNLTSFNRVFKEKYKTTPSLYRKSIRGEENPTDTQSFASDVKFETLPNAVDVPDDPVIYEEVLVDGGADAGILSYSRPWSKTINIGSAFELLHSDVQAHILQLKDELHFRYVRFWDIFSPEMYLDEHKPGQIYNFSRLDRVLDFLVENHLVPHMEVGNKPKKLMRSRSDHMLVSKKGDSPFKSPEMIQYFFSALMRHLIQRYGAEILDKWVFEYWMEEDEETVCDPWPCYNAERIGRYLDNFFVLAKTVRWFGTNLKVGGGGFSLRYGKEWFEYIIRSWAAMEQKPSFVSMYIYPYEYEECEACMDYRVLRSDYMHACLTYAAKVMAREKLMARLVVSEWNFTVSNRNLMNDSVYKGAWMVKNLFDCMDLADVLAYWTGSDLYAECNDLASLCSGNVGLLTKDGIKKPVWYALEFMNSLERFICKKTENVIVTRGKYKNYKILCHHFKPLNYRYYMKSEDDITMDDMEKFFDDRRLMRIYFELPVLPKEIYRVKFLRVNKNSGSILDEWAAMSGSEYMDGDDVAYLKKRCLPWRTICTYEEKDGKIAFTTTLEPNEIQLIVVECRGH